MRGLDPGDWLNSDTLIESSWPQVGGSIPHTVLATAYFAHTTEILSKMAAVIGRAKDSDRYRELFAQIKAVDQAFVNPDGRIEGYAQSGYALVMDFDLLPEALRSKAIEHLLEGLRCHHGHISTGIVTPTATVYVPTNDYSRIQENGPGIPQGKRRPVPSHGKSVRRYSRSIPAATIFRPG